VPYVKTPRGGARTQESGHVINGKLAIKASTSGRKFYLKGKPRRLGVTGGTRSPRAECERGFGASTGYSKIEDLHGALGYGKYRARQGLFFFFFFENLAARPGLGDETGGAQGPAHPGPTERTAPSAGAPGRRGGGRATAAIVIQGRGIDDLTIGLSREMMQSDPPAKPFVGYVQRRGNGWGPWGISKMCPNVAGA